ncbi:MAG: hypothetical protein ACK5Q4_01715 [Phycisphaerae bacterium]|jgi:hypothetical protein
MGQGAILTGNFKVAKVGMRTGRRRPATSTTSATPATPAGRIPRVARLMALAIRLEGLIRSGEVKSQRELAAVANVTPARVTQILNLLHLCPQIQEQLLSVPPVILGKDPIAERELRKVVAIPCWHRQRQELRTRSNSEVR